MAVQRSAASASAADLTAPSGRSRRISRMPIGITDEHLALHAAVRGWVERHCPPSVPRALLDADAEALPAFWPDLVGAGLDSASTSTRSYGGEGYGIPELASCSRSSARAAAPGPFLATDARRRGAAGRGQGGRRRVRPRARRRLADRHGRARRPARGRAGRRRRAPGQRHAAPGALRPPRRRCSLADAGRHLGRAHRRRVRRARAATASTRPGASPR